MSEEEQQAPRHLLVVEDDAAFARTLKRSFERRGYTVDLAASLGEMQDALQGRTPGFAVVDLKLGGEASGLACVQQLHAHDEEMLIVVLTGFASIATAVEAIKRGADNYLTKPVTAEAILRALADEPEAAPELEATMVPLARLEWEHIQQALNETNGNISAAARLLGMHRRSLQRKLAKRPGPERRAPDTGD